MAKLAHVPIPTDDQLAALEAIKAYKQQNPVKFEQKKDALFKKYGLAPDTAIEEVPDASDEELARVEAALKTQNDAE